jgi:hypothetical protein
VPIITVTVDFGARMLVIGEPVMPGPDETAEIAQLRARFRKEMAKYPEKFAEG